MKFIESELSTVGVKEENKHIVEAASAVVASINQKLKTTENELETVKKLLDKERKDHSTTREKIEKSKKN